MCFSAGASFTASAVLAVTGVLTIKKTEKRSQLLFAAIPIIFAVQQFTEGFVWLSLSDSAYVSFNTLSVYVFLIFAQVLWPTWVPLSILLLEPKAKRKPSLYILTLLGGIVSSVLAYYLINYHPVAQINSCHIQYVLSFPMSTYMFSGMFYFIPTVVPLFISGIKRMWVFGAAIMISYIITQLFYIEFVISVWCFFSAILSVIIYYTISKINEGDRSDKMKEWYKN